MATEEEVRMESVNSDDKKIIVNHHSERIILMCDAVYLVELCLEVLLDGSAPDVPFGCCAGKCVFWDDDDEVRRGDAFMKVPARVEVPRSANDVFLNLFLGQPRLDLHKQGRRSATIADDDTFLDEVRAGLTDVVLDSLGIAAQRILGLNPVVVASSRDVTSRLSLDKEVISVIVTIRSAQRTIWTVLGRRKDDKLEQACIGILVGLVRLGDKWHESVRRARHGPEGCKWAPPLWI